MIDIYFLGTSAQFPTKQRNHCSFFLRFKTFKALFDCGEGTQRQMRILKLSPHNVNTIFISHWHGDHTLGLGGIIQSMSASKRTTPLTIYGPKGSEERVKNIINTYYFHQGFEIRVIELVPKNLKVFVSTPEFTVSCFPQKHGIPSIGYVFETKPVRKINLEYTKKFGLKQHKILGDLQAGKDIDRQGHSIQRQKD
jgi:ribonuclease Z